MNTLNGLISDLLTAGLWIGGAVLVLVIYAAFKLRPKKQPPAEDPPSGEY